MVDIDISEFSLLDVVPDALIIVDKQGIVVMFNVAAEEMFGYTRQEIIGQAIEILVPERLRTRHLAHRTEYIDEDPQARPMGTGKFYGLRKDGTEIPVEIMLRPFLQPEGLIIIAAIRDITSTVRRHETELRRAQRGEIISRLASGLVHDINNLTTVVIGYADLIRGKSSDTFIREALSNVHDSGVRIAHLTRRFLTLGREQIIIPIVFNLNEIVSELSRILQRVLGEKISVFTSVRPDPCYVEIDRNLLEQCIMNLAINARDAMPHGGQLHLGTSTTILENAYARMLNAKEGHYCVLTVSDTGVGMDEETRRHIFEPFFSTKEPGLGSGLGLTAVREVITQASGYVQVHSEVGHGASFKIYLPKKEYPIKTEEMKIVEMPTGDETILLVEDDDGVLSIATAILEKCGYKILAALGGEEALRLSIQESGQIDLVLTDTIMPRMSGPLLVQRLTKLRPGIKVLFMSGYSAGMLQELLKNDDGTAFLSKPFTAQELTKKVREVLDKI